MTDHDALKDGTRGTPVAGPPSWGEVATRPLTIGVLLMAAGGGATGLALVSYGYAEQGRGSVLRRMAEAVFEYESAFYGLAVVFLLASVLFLVIREDALAPLVYAVMSIAVLLVIPLSVLVLDVAPWVFGGRLTSGSLTQLTLVFSPIVALVGWLVAVYATVGSRGSPSGAVVSRTPEPKDPHPAGSAHEN